MSPKIDVEIIHNAIKKPTEVIITKRGRKLKCKYYSENKLTFEGPEAVLPKPLDIFQMEYLFSTPISKSRPVYYDRNPVSIHLQYHDAAGPHAATERWTYTVPEGKKFLAEHLFCRAKRASAAAPAGALTNRIRSQQEGSAVWLYLLAAYLSSSENTAGNQDYQLAGPMLFGQNQTIACHTTDLSTGGSILYTSVLKGTEFDA